MTGELSAGAGRAEIDIPVGAYPIEGFRGERDRLNARAVVIGNASTRVALAVVELTSIPDEIVTGLIDVVGAAAGVTPDQVLILASHTFSAPHLVPLAGLPDAQRSRVRAVQDAVEAALRSAATTAGATMRPVRALFGTGEAGVNVNRDIETADGWGLGVNEMGPTDRGVGVLRLEDRAGRPVAVLMNYAVQSSVMGDSTDADGTRMVTGDLAGAAARHVEDQYGGDTVALFLIGAAGDQAPCLTANRLVLDRHGRSLRADAGPAGHLLVDLLGERLGAAVVRVSETACPVLGANTLRVRHDRVIVPGQHALPREEIHPNRQHSFIPHGSAHVPIWILQIGDLALAGVQVEFSAVTGIDIKDRSPFPQTMVMTMVNGAAKYLPDAGSYDRRSYEALASRYGKGSAELVADQILDLLNGLARERGSL